MGAPSETPAPGLPYRFRTPGEPSLNAPDLALNRLLILGRERSGLPSLPERFLRTVKDGDETSRVLREARGSGRADPLEKGGVARRPSVGDHLRTLPEHPLSSRTGAAP
jgi:hypothetical protein